MLIGISIYRMKSISFFFLKTKTTTLKANDQNINYGDQNVS
jgi:hypothetical protein